MKKSLFTFAIVFSYLCLAGFPVFAAAPVPVNICPGGQFSPLCNFTADSFGTIVNTLINVFLILIVVIAVFFLIWGGAKWILSGGDKAAIESARNTIIGAVVGLSLAFLAYFILNVVIRFFIPGFDLRAIQLPTL